MKNLLTSFLLLLATIVLVQMSGCTKPDPAPVTNKTFPIEGLWIGNYTVNGEAGLGQQYYSFVIKPDGKMIADTKGANQQHLSIGNWTLNGTTLTTNHTCVYGISFNVGVVQTTTATWANTGKIIGTWSHVAPASGSGTFTLTRVN